MPKSLNATLTSTNFSAPIRMSNCIYEVGEHKMSTFRSLGLVCIDFFTY